MNKLCAWLGAATMLLAVCIVARVNTAQAANDPLKPYVVLVLDTSGSMDEATNTGPPSCGGKDSKLDHARCAINQIVNAYGDMTFALARFRATMSGTTTANTFPAGCNLNAQSCSATDEQFELLTPLVDGTNDKAAVWTNFTGNTCTATGTDPEIWSAPNNTPLAGALLGARTYWLGVEKAANGSTVIWPASAGHAGGFDPIGGDPKNDKFLPTGCNPAANCLGADATFPAGCCQTQCRPYITIMLTDGDASCSNGQNPGDQNAAAAALYKTPYPAGMPAAMQKNYRIQTKPIGFGKPPGDPQIEAMAHAGGAADDGNPATFEGYYASDEAGLQLAISAILNDAIRTEVCNHKDDDCDGFFDEGFTGFGTCNNNKFGKCRVNGTADCRADGQGVECDAGVAACVGKSITNGCSVTNAAGAMVAGTCQAGNPQLVCIPTPAVDEIAGGCNNIDDDCDGRIDEGVTGCTCTVATEVCDGKDNDCDTRTDENTAVPCNNGTCMGVRPCNGSAGLGACTAAVPDPLGEHICDGLDDNCDGNKDGFNENCSNMFCPGGSCTGGAAPEKTCVGGTRAGKRCDTNPDFDQRNNPAGVTGSACQLEGAACACKTGNRTCPLNGTGVYTACVQEIEPSVEICNGIDDDCDGKIDETPSTACTMDSQCPPITPTCDTTAHLCQPADCSVNSCGGELLCVNGAAMCTQTAGVDDTCNNVDEDCDMKVDEAWKCADPDGPDNIPGNADDCSCNVAGQCNAHESCQNGSVVCMGDPVGQETCNCQDDDCDGTVDENAGSLCGAGATCDESACQCAFPCAQGEFPCPAGKLCNANHFCVADPCFNVTCTQVQGDLQVCRPKPSNPADHECVSACDPTVITCPNTTVCFKPAGDCRPDDCTTFPDYCTGAQSCINGTCVSNPCTGVTCDAGQFCNNGNCYGSCSGVECPTGQRCELGTCAADPCGKQCPFGKACDPQSGTCVANPCDAFQCPQGQWCDPEQGAMCVDDPCAIFNITCEDGQICRGGSCFDADTFKPDAAAETHVTTGGGGGCSTSGDANGTFVFGIGLAMALTLRRRKRLGRAVSVGLLIAATALLGCDVNEYCLNCETGDGGHGGDDGAADDGGSGSADDGGMVDDSGDGGNCVPTGPEMCDGKDNDCNGQIDDGTLPTIGDQCDSQVGECALGHKICKAGSVVCSTQGPEICDNKDNNCDGTADEGDPGGGAVCGTNTGECVAGVNRCVTGTIQCVGAIGPATETCNNRDDDCDGLFDENLTLGPCVAGMDGPAQGNTGECDLGTRQCVGGVTKCVGAVFPVFEQCDTGNLDSDCDGQPSNGYNLATDPQNCGMCGHKCNLPNAFENCGVAPQASGVCGIAACATNFFDNNHNPADGCEFNCGHPFLGAEICNGIDDDCDGLIDGADPDMIAPTNLCDPDGACSTMTVLSCDATLGWRCHYNNPNVQTSDAAHTQIISETRCDSDIVAGSQADNDCDGLIDEGQSNLNQACNNGMQGICRGTGTFVCDTTTRTNPATCKITVPGLPPGTETCDGLDNNCDGIVDDPANEFAGNAVGQEWSIIPGTNPPVQIMKYEASQPGTQSNYVCSRAGVLPWVNIRQPEAEAACATIGARLCTEAEWQNDCEPDATYPIAVTTSVNVTDFTFIEAEDAFANTTQGLPAAQRAWTKVSPVNFDGITAMQVPSNGFSQPVLANALTASSRLDFRLTTLASTTYRFWLHMRTNAASVVGSGTPAVSSAVNATATSDASTAVGDLVIVSTFTYTTGNLALTHTLQSGFTQIVTQNHNDGNNDGLLSIAYKVASVAGAQTYTAYTTTGGTNLTSITVIKAGSYDVSTIASASTNDTSNARPDPPDIGSNATQPSILLGISAWHEGAAAVTTPTPSGGFTLDTDAAGSVQGELAVEYAQITNGAGSDPGQWNDNVTPNGTISATIRIGMHTRIYVGVNADAAGAASAVVTSQSLNSWQWVQAPNFTTAAGKTDQFVSLYTFDDGVYVDEIAISRHDAQPTFDNSWSYATNPRTSAPTTCNVDDYDTDSVATGDQDDIINTGSRTSCFSEHGTEDTYDLSGNVKEWVQERAPGQNPIRGGASNNEETGATCKSDFTLAPDTFFFPNVGFRCCRLAP
ncbi:MAG TPA: MopE-related protein [Kofleriaceae bacterium]